MMLDRKKRLVDSLKSPTPSPEKPIVPSQLTRNWATVGFFDASPTYESIRPSPPPPSMSSAAPTTSTISTTTILAPPVNINSNVEPLLRNSTEQQSSSSTTGTTGTAAGTTTGTAAAAVAALISPKSKPRSFHRLTSLDIEDSNIIISVGDVFEQIRRKHIRNGTRLLYQVLEIFPQSKSVLVQSVYGKEKKTFKELLDTTEYNLIVTDKAYSTKRTFQAQKSIRDPLLQDKVKYSGREGRDSLFSLFRQAPDEYPIPRSKDPLASPRPITPRLTYVLECRKQHIPPIPLLTRCFQESYPVLDLSNQSIGIRYILPLAQSLGDMKFLKEINLTNNRLDSKSVYILMRGIVNSHIESIILNENKIGKLGVKGIQCLVSGEWDETSNDIFSSGGSSSVSSSPAGSCSSSISSTPSSSLNSSILPFSPIQKSRNSLSSSYHSPVAASSASSASSSTAHSNSQSTLLSELSLFTTSPPRPLEPLTPLSLRKLSLQSCSLGDNILSKLIQTLEFHCLTLRFLNISSNSCSSFTITALSQLLSSNVLPLESLDLSWNHLGTDQAITLLRSLSSNSTLKILYLDYNGIHQGVLSTIAITGGMKVTGDEFFHSLKTPTSTTFSTPLSSFPSSSSSSSSRGNGLVQLPSNQTIELISLTNNSIPTQLLKQYQENFLTDLKLIQQSKSEIL